MSIVWSSIVCGCSLAGFLYFAAKLIDRGTQ